MRTRITICTCAVAMILVTACSLSEAADRNKLGSGDPKAPSPKTSGIQEPAVSQTAQAIPLQEVPDRAEGTRAELNTLLPAEASRQMLKRMRRPGRRTNITRGSTSGTMKGSSMPPSSTTN